MADTNRTEVPTAWLTRAGRHGEREDFVLEHGLACSGFHRLPDLSGVSNRADMESIVRKLLPDKTKMSVANYVGQLWALRAGVRTGDLVVLPRKETRELALGIVTREYWYRADPDPARRHVVSVDWKRTDVPWLAAQEDLRRSLSSPRTICAVKCSDGARRLNQLMTVGRDPGVRQQAAAKATINRIKQRVLHTMLVAALNGRVVERSAPGTKPLEIDLQAPLPSQVRVYMYNATRPPGGRPAGEHKIQLIVPGQRRGERGNFDNSDERTVLLVGYAVEEAVFILWDAGAYRDFSYSMNLQVKSETILAAFAGEIGLQKRVLRPRRRTTIRETVVTATADRLTEAIEMRVDLSLDRLLDELD